MTWEHAHPVSRRRVWRPLLLPVLLVFTVHCAVKHRVDISPVSPTVPATVASPVRAHLADGSTVIFAQGVTITDVALEGRGMRYNPWRTAGVRVQRIERAEVVGMETFRERVKNDVGFFLAATGVVLAFLALLVATSCFWCEGDLQPDGDDETEWAPAEAFEGRPGTWVPVH